MFICVNKMNSIHWFRKGLRLHDNPALLAAVEKSQNIWPIFILDPWFVKNMKIGPNRWRFLLQSLEDLDLSLRQLNSRLFILHGTPKEVITKLIKKWKINLLTFEYDSEPYAQMRDNEIEIIAQNLGIEVIKKISNTLYNPERIIAHHGKLPLSYQAFLSIINQLDPPAKPVITLTNMKGCKTPVETEDDNLYKIPTLEELNINSCDLEDCLYPGGESEALKRLEKFLLQKNWICKFEKPKTEPNSIIPSTTVLSPYVKFGCLSIRTFYHKIKEIYKESKNGYTKPPVSLDGQLLWREFFYTVGSSTPNFDQMQNNPICKQIPWKENKQFLDAWANAKTGYPFIDAIMTQLRKEGWIHHLARHAVACFLTRGDLWLSWVEGMKVFEELLLDADWSLNAGNWMWLSASAFYHQYFRIYSPIAFGKKTDTDGIYIKKYVPLLKNFPSQYIYEPWKAPIKLQQEYGCIIGKDYPFPIVDHEKAKAQNLKLMSLAYKNQERKNLEDKNKSSSMKINKIKQSTISFQSSKNKKKKV